MQKPCEGHWSAAKRVLKYLKGTQDFGLKYTQVGDFSLIGYSDSDLALIPNVGHLILYG